MKKFIVLVFYFLLTFISCKRAVLPNEIRIGRINYPSSLNPFFTDDSSANYYTLLVFQPLCKYDSVNKRYWGLLAGGPPVIVFDSVQKKYSAAVHLRDDATWDDQTPLTINDVLFSFKLSFLARQEEWKSALEIILSITPDSNTGNFQIQAPSFDDLRLMLETPVVQEAIYDPHHSIENISMSTIFSDSLSKNDNDILKKFITQLQSQIMNSPNNFNRGSGPYTIESYSNDEIIFVKKKNWYGTPHNGFNPFLSIYPQKIIYKFYTSEEELLHAFIDKEIDCADNLDKINAAAIKNNSQLNETSEVFTKFSGNGYYAVNKRITNASPASTLQGFWEGGFKMTIYKE